MAERAFVTGATGFIGSRVCRELDRRGWSVHGLRREESSTDNLDDVAVTWTTGDILDRDSLATGMASADHVFHLAGLSLKNADADTVRRVNVAGTRNVLDVCREAGVERLVFTSSAGALGKTGTVTEADPIEPVGAYQRSKAGAEDLVRGAVDDGLDAVIVNPTSVFGPGDEKFTARLLRLATDPKLFVYFPGGANVVSVDDIAEGHVQAAECGRPGERYILGGDNLEYGEALAMIARRADGHRPLLRVPSTAIHAAGPVAELVRACFGGTVFPFDRQMARLATQNRFYSTEKARTELDYEHTPFAEHVDEAIDWYRNEQR